MECEKVLENSSETIRRDTVGQLGEAKRDGPKALDEIKMGMGMQTRQMEVVW